MTRYREACQSNDAEFLNRIRVVHRGARAFLTSADVKSEITRLIDERTNSMERQSVWNAILAVMAVVQNFPRNITARVFAESISSITATLPALDDAWSTQNHQ